MSRQSHQQGSSASPTSQQRQQQQQQQQQTPPQSSPQPVPSKSTARKLSTPQLAKGNTAVTASSAPQTASDPSALPASAARLSASAPASAPRASVTGGITRGGGVRITSPLTPLQLAAATTTPVAFRRQVRDVDTHSSQSFHSDGEVFSRQADGGASTTTLQSTERGAAAGSIENHLLYLGKLRLPHHPTRMRYLANSQRRLLLYGKQGYQEMTVENAALSYKLLDLHWQPPMSDCVQTNDLSMYVVAHLQNAAVISSYDEAMTLQKRVEVAYPLGCLTSLATDANSTHLYGTNEELNCVMRFRGGDLCLSRAEIHGFLWRPFDCCTSQQFTRSDGSHVQFLFVTNLDAGIVVFDTEIMEVVMEAGGDLGPGAKYVTYDPKRSILFVSSSSERLLRCYHFDAFMPDQKRPLLHKIGDFLVAKKKPTLRSSGPQCVMWDTALDQLAVLSWSHMKGVFMAKVFRPIFEEPLCGGGAAAK